MTIYPMSQCPPASEIDIPALQAKYRAERDRRIKKDHNDQYIAASGKWKEAYEVDPYTPVTGLATVWFRSLEIIYLTQGDRTWRLSIQKISSRKQSGLR